MGTEASLLLYSTSYLTVQYVNQGKLGKIPNQRSEIYSSLLKLLVG